MRRLPLVGVGPLFAPWGAPPLSGKGVWVPESIADDFAASVIYSTDELTADGRVTLDELAELGGAGWALRARGFPNQAISIGQGYCSALSSAFAFEKYGMYEAALGYVATRENLLHNRQRSSTPRSSTCGRRRTNR